MHHNGAFPASACYMPVASQRVSEGNAVMESLPLHSYQRLLNSLTTAVLVFSPKLRLRYINLAAESLLAVSARQVQDARLSDMLLHAEQDLQDIQAVLHTAHSFTKRKTQLHLPHGNVILVDYTVTPVTDIPGAALLIEIQSMNYTERISRDEALISTHATTRELVRGLAHEIKNPLGGIRGAAQLLAAELQPAADRPGSPLQTTRSDLREYTNVIIEEADRLRNLVDRLIGSRQPMAFRPINIHEVLERVRSLIEAEVSDRHISLVRDYDPSIPELYGDFEQLIQAVLNIARNAVQALEGQHDGRIELRTRVMHHATIGTRFHRLVACLEVIDNGPGVPADLISHIFYPMISGRADGTGLGLSIAHSIINQHSGIIECQSQPGCTRFVIYLPVLPAATATPGAAASPSAAAT